MPDLEVLDWSLSEVAQRISRGEVSSEDVTSASIRAFEKHGERLNAVVEIDGDGALAVARQYDKERSQSKSRGPLHGVPMAHKDMFYRAGRECASGSILRRGFVPNETATVLRRLDDAGAIDLGRLNMVEFALGLTGHNSITGHPRNPYDLERITGGSSSGPVASVAARLTYASLGSDTGGSIRIPAACTGLVGIKPTYSRVSRAAALPLCVSLDHVGPLTRTAEDAALLLGLIAGHDPRDPVSSHRPVPDYNAEIRKSIDGLRFAVALDDLEVELDDQIGQRLDHALQTLRSLGVQPTKRGLPNLEVYNDLRRVLMLGEVAALHAQWVKSDRDAYNPQTLARMEPGFALGAMDYLRALRMRTAALREFVKVAFDGVDLIFMPAMPKPVLRLDMVSDNDDAGFVKLVNELGHFICPFNYLGLPAISIPIEPTSDGLPMAMQLVGRPFNEGLLLRVAHKFDEATNYSKRKPSISIA